MMLPQLWNVSTWVILFEEFIQMHQQIRHRTTHEKLKEGLIEHQWAVKGDNNVGM